jgi:hypothetical protein
MISVWATDSLNSEVKLNSGKTFTFKVDVLGASSLTPQSVPAAGVFSSNTLAIAAHLLTSKVETRNAQNVIFCAKASQKDCQDSDWSVTACDSNKGCTIEKDVLSISSANAFGTYALCNPACTATSSPPPPPPGGGGGGGGSAPVVAGSSGSSPSTPSISGGAIAAIVIVPIISIALIVTAVMIRNGRIFQNVDALQFMRPAGSNHPIPNASSVSATSVSHVPSSPSPVIGAAEQVELRVMDSDSRDVRHPLPPLKSDETASSSAMPSIATDQQVSSASVAVSASQAAPETSSRSNSRVTSRSKSNQDDEEKSSPQVSAASVAVSASQAAPETSRSVSRSKSRGTSRSKINQDDEEKPSTAAVAAGAGVSSATEP